MKLLSSLGFLIAAGLIVYIGYRINKLASDLLRGISHSAITMYIWQLAILLLSFSQFWLLTRIFPFYLILLLIGVTLFGPISYTVFGALSGITLPHKKRKIRALTTILGLQQGVQNPVVPFVFITQFFIFLTILAGSLFVFWRYPIGDSDAKILITIFLFTLPNILFPLSFIVLSWSIVTSEFIDDDIRNAHLAQAFSRIMYNTIYLVFPIWLFKQEVMESFGRFYWSLPVFWILLSTPLLLFIFGNILPYFIGMSRFRVQARAMLDWRRKWVTEVLQLVKLPNGDVRSRGLDEKLAELEIEIKRRVSENALLDLYRSLVMPRRDHDDSLSLHDQRENHIEAEILPPTENQSEIALPSADAVTTKYITKIRSLMDSPQMSDRNRESKTELQQAIIDFLNQNKSQLVEWDIRFEDLRKTLQLYEIGSEGKSKNIAGFLEVALRDTNREISMGGQRRNTRTGAFLSIASVIIIGLIKTYQTEIINLVGVLVHGT
jgi:hypothetical protein